MQLLEARQRARQRRECAAAMRVVCDIKAKLMQRRELRSSTGNGTIVRAFKKKIRPFARRAMVAPPPARARERAPGRWCRK